MGKICFKEKTPDELYERYLTSHVRGVKEIYESIIKPILVKEALSEDLLNKVTHCINCHDDSKKSDLEWQAYRDHFYDKDNHPRSSDDFNYAWNHHQKTNPHHWQYWCLINDCDEPQVQPLEIPVEYVIEMLCDWQSAGLHYGNTAYEWYEKQKDKMILHDNTRELIEKYVQYLK